MVIWRRGPAAIRSKNWLLLLRQAVRCSLLHLGGITDTSANWSLSRALMLYSHLTKIPRFAQAARAALSSIDCRRSVSPQWLWALLPRSPPALSSQTWKDAYVMANLKSYWYGEHTHLFFTILDAEGTWHGEKSQCWYIYHSILIFQALWLWHYCGVLPST